MVVLGFSVGWVGAVDEVDGWFEVDLGGWVDGYEVVVMETMGWMNGWVVGWMDE